MALNNQNGMGPNFAPAYELSGVPYVTSSIGNTLTDSPQKIVFPQVTRFFQISNTGPADLRIGFSRNGVMGNGGAVSGSSYETAGASRCKNYYVLGTSGSSGGGTTRLEIRCKELFLMRDTAQNTGFTLIAGLTGIDKNQFPTLTGSEGFQGVG